jgi:hypothetical protein
MKKLSILLTLATCILIHTPMHGKLHIPYAPLIKYVVATIYKNCWGTSPDIKLSAAETKRYQGQREYAPAYPQDVVRHLMRISAVKQNTHIRSRTLATLASATGSVLAYRFWGAITSNISAVRLAACGLGAYAVGYFTSSRICNHAKRMVLENRTRTLMRETPTSLTTHEGLSTTQKIVYDNLGQLAINQYALSHSDPETFARLRVHWEKVTNALDTE